VIAGKEIFQENPEGKGYDPIHLNECLYRYSIADWRLIDQAIQCAKDNETKWSKIMGKKRRRAVGRAKAYYREAESSTCRMMRDTHYKIAHHLCKRFEHNTVFHCASLAIRIDPGHFLVF
jgi:acyl-CoA reductase-like NAD-dependent aldehyde dehydrogenase